MEVHFVDVGLGTCQPLTLLPAVLRPQAEFGRGYIDAKRRRPRCVACMGNIVATLSPAGCDVRRLNEHQQAVRRLASQPGGKPMCLEPA